MEVFSNKKNDVMILCASGIIAESDIGNFKNTLITTLGDNNKIIINMGDVLATETALWQIANTLCEFANEAARHNKKVAAAELPSDILGKANQLLLGKKMRIFTKKEAAISYMGAA